MNDAEKNRPNTAEASIASLTAENRGTWYQARADHFSAGINKASLSMIEKAIFAVSLDDESPEDPGKELEYSPTARKLFHGNGTNRWVDKSFNFIVFPNGRCGLHVEHSWADAPVCSHMMEYVVIVRPLSFYLVPPENQNPQSCSSDTTPSTSMRMATTRGLGPLPPAPLPPAFVSSFLFCVFFLLLLLLFLSTHPSLTVYSSPHRNFSLPGISPKRPRRSLRPPSPMPPSLSMTSTFRWPSTNLTARGS